MRTLFVTHSYPRFDGDVAGAFVLRLGEALRDAGVEVRVVAPAAPDLAPSAIIRGIPVTRYRYASDARQTLAYSGTMAEQVKASWGGKVALLGMLRAVRGAASAEMRAFKPDVVHAHWWFPNALALRFSPGAVPLVVTMHGSDVRLAQGSGLAQSAYRMVARRASALTAVSHWLAGAAEAFAPGFPVRVAPMPVDVDLFPPGGGPRGRTVLFVGRLNAQKGVGDLLDALARTDADVLCDIVGEGPDRATLEALAARLGVGHRVRWHGELPQSAVAALYRAAGAVVLPSREEGLGLVAVEAQLAGAPVIAYRSGGLTDVVDRGTGTLVEPGDIPSLAVAIRDALRPTDTAARDAARAAMLARFSPAAAAARYLDVYREVARR